jgi:phage terminase large subunit GpA-like protein
MTTYVIETGEQVMLSIGGGEPQPMESVEAACEAIEQAEGMQEPMEDEGAAMQAGFDKARGSTAGMIGGM